MEKILKLYKYVDGINDTPFPNNEQQAILYDFTYDAKRMGNNIPTISGTIMHSLCLDELWGNELVYVVYKGEKYFVKQKPTSSYSNEDTRYKHEINFISERNILNEVYFYDVVDSSVSYDKYVSNSSNVVFYGDINELAQRLREALKYAKIDYDVVVDANVTSETKLVTFSDMFIIDVLNEAYSIYKVPHYFDGKAIHFGYTNNNIDTILKYGIDNALLSIRKNYSNKRIINRATGIGSADNIPYYYPNFDAKGVTNILYNGVDNQSAIVSNKAKYRKVKLGDVFTYASANSYTLEYIDKSKYSVTKEPTLLSEPYETTKKYELILDFPFNVDIHREMVMYIGYSKDHLTRAYTRLYRNSELWDKFTTLGTFYYDRLIEGEYNISITLAFEFKETDEKQTITNEDIPDIVDALELSIHTDISGYHNWKLNSSPLDVQIEDYGIQLNVTPKNGDKITFKQVSYIPPQPNLMPPIYRENGGLERFYNALNNTYINPETKEYYLFENPYQEGKQKEEIVSFDYIKPSIVGITNAQGQRIDMFVEFAYDTNDNDEFDENGNYLHPYFFAKLRKFDGDYGFNLFDHAIEENEMKIAMTSGSCGACEFIIGVSEKTQENTVQVDSNGNLLRDSNGNVLFGSPQAQQNDTINNEVWIALKKDIETFGVIMPNATNNYKPSANDTFVILHIDLPDEYIIAAENRLKEEIIKHIYTNNTAKFNLSIMFSRIYLADNPTIANSINENARIKVAYNEFVYTLYVSSYSYRMRSDEPLPEIEVELSEELEIKKAPLKKITSTSQQIAQSVEQVNNKVTTTDRVVSSTQSQTQANVQNIEERIANIERILRNSQGNTDNLQDYYDRITKVVAEIEKFWKYNEENNALITEYNVVSQGTMSFGGIDDGESGEGDGTGITSFYDIPEIAVSAATLADGQSLVYDATSGKWVNRLVQGGSGSGVNMDYVWAALAEETNEKINASHIPDLSDVYLPLSGGELIGTGYLYAQRFIAKNRLCLHKYDDSNVLIGGLNITFNSSNDVGVVLMEAGTNSDTFRNKDLVFQNQTGGSLTFYSASPYEDESNDITLIRQNAATEEKTGFWMHKDGLTFYAQTGVRKLMDNLGTYVEFSGAGLAITTKESRYQDMVGVVIDFVKETNSLNFRRAYWDSDVGKTVIDTETPINLTGNIIVPNADTLDGLHASDFCKAFNVRIWGNSFNGTGGIDGNLVLKNGTSIKSWVADNSISYDLLYLSTANNFQIGYNTAIIGKFKTNLHGYGIDFRSKGTDGATMSLTTAGNVGIGTTTPAYKLEVNGTTHLNGKVTLTKDVVLNNYTAIKFKDSNGAELNTIMVGADNALTIGADHSVKNYETRIKGVGVTLFHGGTQVLSLTSISNISAKNILPFTNNTYNLGTSDTRWGVLYAYYGSFTNGVNNRHYYTLDGTIRAFDSNNSYLEIGGGYVSNDLPVYINGRPLMFRASDTTDLTIGADGIAIFSKMSCHDAGIKIGEATLVWDAENQCLVVDKDFVSNGTMSFGGFDLGIGNGSTIGEGLTINTSDLEEYVTPLILKANDIYAPLLLENGKGAYYLVPKDNGNFIGLALSTDSSASVASTTSNLVVRQLWAISSHSTNLPSICIGTDYKTKATFSYVKGTTNTAASVTLDVALTHPSDITRKQILEDVCLSTEVIANAPLFKFTWKNSTDKAVHIGTSAQYWLDYAPELTALYDDRYSLDYATLGVMMGKSNATEIELLKAEVKELRLKVENYERMLNN